MSSRTMGATTLPNLYEEPTLRQQNEYRVVTEAGSSPLFYIFAKILSTFMCIVFLLLFALSLSSVVSVNWSVGLVGLLGSIGLAGSVWLSESVLNKC